MLPKVWNFALVYTVFERGDGPCHSGNSFYGLAIGFTVLAQAVAVGKISGGAFNPAVAIWRFVVGLANGRILDVLVQRVSGCRCRSGFLSRSNREKLHEPISSSHDKAQGQTNQSIGAV